MVNMEINGHHMYFLVILVDCQIWYPEITLRAKSSLQLSKKNLEYWKCFGTKSKTEVKLSDFKQELFQCSDAFLNG